MVDVKYLSNQELQCELERLGFSPGPILPSTRTIYEKKLKQLMVLNPCVSPEINKTREQERAEDCDGTKDSELNDSIVLEGNIIISTEKCTGPQKNTDYENRDWQKDRVKPNSDNNDWRRIMKTLRMSRQRALKPCMRVREDLPDLNRTRCEVRMLLRQSQDTIVPDCCYRARKSASWEADPLPVGLKLAALGIFVIVVFVYITVERKSFFA